MNANYLYQGNPLTGLYATTKPTIASTFNDGNFNSLPTSITQTAYNLTSSTIYNVAAQHQYLSAGPIGYKYQGADINGLSYFREADGGEPLTIPAVFLGWNQTTPLYSHTQTGYASQLSSISTGLTVNNATNATTIQTSGVYNNAIIVLYGGGGGGGGGGGSAAQGSNGGNALQGTSGAKGIYKASLINYNSIVVYSGRGGGGGWGGEGNNGNQGGDGQQGVIGQASAVWAQAQGQDTVATTVAIANGGAGGAVGNGASANNRGTTSNVYLGSNSSFQTATISNTIYAPIVADRGGSGGGGGI